MGAAWVIDTCSLVEIKQLPNVVKISVFTALAGLVDSNQLFFPKEVLDELVRGVPTGARDAVLQWAQENFPVAGPLADLFPQAQGVVKRLPDLIDPQKPGLQEADPYVIAFGLDRQENGYDVTIITDDYRPKPRKTSLSDAAGVFRLPSVTLRVFLVTEGYWDGTTGT